MKNFMTVTFTFVTIAFFSTNSFALGTVDRSEIEGTLKKLEKEGYKCDSGSSITEWADDQNYTTTTVCKNDQGKKVLKIEKYQVHGISRCSDVTAVSIEIREGK